MPLFSHPSLTTRSCKLGGDSQNEILRVREVVRPRAISSSGLSPVKRASRLAGFAKREACHCRGTETRRMTLAAAAQTTFARALASYRNCVGSITYVNIAQTQLLQARNASTDACSMALSDTATLALATEWLQNRLLTVVTEKGLSH